MKLGKGKIELGFGMIPGVSMTLRIRPSSRTVVSSWHEEVTPPKLGFESNTLRPMMVLAVALLPLPVFPTKTRVLASAAPRGGVISQSSESDDDEQRISIGIADSET